MGTQLRQRMHRQLWEATRIRRQLPQERLSRAFSSRCPFGRSFIFASCLALDMDWTKHFMCWSSDICLSSNDVFYSMLYLVPSNSLQRGDPLDVCLRNRISLVQL